MSYCRERGDALGDVAAGATLTDEFTMHLRACDACTAELERRRALLERIDTVAREWLNPAPPSGLTANVFSAVARERRTRPALATWLAAAGAIAASLILTTSLILHDEVRVHAPQPGSIATWQSPTAELLRPSVSILDARFTPIGGIHAP